MLAFDGVVLADLATPCEIFGRVRDRAGRAAYDVRVCSLAPDVESQHLRLTVPTPPGPIGPWYQRAFGRLYPLIYPHRDLEEADRSRSLPDPGSALIGPASEKPTVARRGIPV